MAKDIHMAAIVIGNVARLLGIASGDCYARENTESHWADMAIPHLRNVAEHLGYTLVPLQETTPADTADGEAPQMLCPTPSPANPGGHHEAQIDQPASFGPKARSPSEDSGRASPEAIGE